MWKPIDFWWVQFTGHNRNRSLGPLTWESHGDQTRYASSPIFQWTYAWTQYTNNVRYCHCKYRPNIHKRTILTDRTLKVICYIFQWPILLWELTKKTRRYVFRQFQDVKTDTFCFPRSIEYYPISLTQHKNILGPSPPSNHWPSLGSNSWTKHVIIFIVKLCEMPSSSVEVYKAKPRQVNIFDG